MKYRRIFYILLVQFLHLCSFVQSAKEISPPSATSLPSSSSSSSSASPQESAVSPQSVVSVPAPPKNVFVNNPFLLPNSIAATSKIGNDTGEERGDFKGGLFDLMQEGELGDLLLVQTIFTVTDQAPKETYKECPYNGQWKRIGKGNITPYGIKKMYQLGKYIQRRYKPYLDGIIAKNIIAASGDSRAEEETNLAFLAGCCKPAQQNVWSYMDGIFPFWWQPIGVARLSSLNYHCTCAKAEKIERTPEMLKEVREFLVENSDFIARILPSISHKTARNESLLYKMAWIAEGMITEEKYFGSKWKEPNWIGYAGENGLNKFKALYSLLIKSSQYYPFSYKQLKLGPLFKIFLSNMLDASKMKSNMDILRKKFFVFTTNQYIMNMIMQAMDIYDQVPAKSSGIIMELRRHAFYDEPIVYLYFAGYVEIPQMSLIPIGNSAPFKKHCVQNFCPMSGFIKSLAKYISQNAELCNEFALKPGHESDKDFDRSIYPETYSLLRESPEED